MNREYALKKIEEFREHTAEEREKFDSDPLNLESLRFASHILSTLGDDYLEGVYPSRDGYLNIIYKNGNRELDIDCYENNEVLILGAVLNSPSPTEYYSFSYPNKNVDRAVNYDDIKDQIYDWLATGNPITVGNEQWKLSS